MLGSMMVGASSVPPDSITRTWAPDADNSAARTEPAAPAPTTMKSYRLSLLDSLIILNSQPCAVWENSPQPSSKTGSGSDLLLYLRERFCRNNPNPGKYGLPSN